MGGIDMRQEDKELVLKDICARLPYGVKINTIQGDFTLLGLTNERVFTTCEVEGCHNDFPIELIKPYLFPLSSITEEQTEELIKLINTGQNNNNEFIRTLCRIEFYHKHHFDYMGLIEKGLAIDATGLNIY